MWDADGHARSRPRHGVDAGSILGLPALRPAFLVHLPAAEPREAETCDGARVVTRDFRLDDDDDLDDVDDDDDDDDLDDEEDESEDDEEDEGGDDDEPEPWQVLPAALIPAKGQVLLDFGH
jgi:hypothetical protein